MVSSTSNRSMVSMLVLGVMTGLVGLLLSAERTNAQVEPITASQVMDRETLKQFVLYAKQDAESVTSADEVPAWISQIEQDGAWKHDDIFLIVLIPGGTVFRHTNDASLNLQNINDVEDARGNKVVQALMAAGAVDGGGFVEYYLDGDPVLAEDSDSTKTAYAVNYTSGITNGTVTIVSGFYQDISGTGDAAPTLDPESLKPDVTAAEVMDRVSLKQFVNGSIASFQAALEQVGIDELVKNHDIFHEEGGYWRRGNTYLFALTTEGTWFLHGANKAKENTNAWNDTDINGVKFIQELISAAKHEEGGFVEYHYDDPDVMGDEDTGSPKLSYARTLTFHGNEYVVGSGLYFELEDHVGTIELTVEPNVLTESETRAVTVTATQTRTEGALPVSVRMPLSLSGTAVENTDYTVTGEMVVTIPAEMTEGSTELTFTVEDDGIDEPDGETIVVTASHDMEELATAEITVKDATPITASEVVDRQTLEAFVEGAKTHIEGIYEAGEALAPFLNSTRVEGDWKHGNTFLMLMLLDGTVLFHAGDVSASGKSLFELEDDTGKTVVRDLIETGRLGGGHVDYTWDDPNDDADDPAKVAYATSFFGKNYGNQVILVGGFYQDVSHIEPPVYDASLIPEPEVTAAEVMDRETLQKFVIGAMRGYIGALQAHGTDRYNDILNVFRIEDGHWRHGSIYLFIINDQGYVIFHGADRTQEARNQSHLEDINGVKFVQEFIKVATAGGGFVEYQYDDPSVPGDEVTGTPKLSYVQSFEARSGRRVIFGAGIYFDPSDYDRETMLSVDPAMLSEGDGPQTVTVTATQTGDPIPVTTRLPLTLSGTATSDDYTVTGDMHILIPPEGSVGTTELAFTVADDGVEEVGGETIIVTASHDMEELATATITVNDRTVPVLEPGEVTAAGVMDRTTLKSFVQAAASAYKGAIDEVGFDRHGDVVEAFRVEDGTWRLGEIYIFFLQTDGLLLFHGATPSREDVNIFDAQDLNGVYYVRELIQAAQGGGGYVEYYFDNPAVSGDEELGSPKVSYAEAVVVDEMELVIGAGFYFDFTGYTPGITLSVNPETVSEEGGAQTVTVTATQTSMTIPISTVLPLALSGTATSDDYSVSGALSVTIPGEATEGSTQLTFTVVNDDVYESGGETIIVTAGYDDQDLDSATVVVTDSYDAPAAVGTLPAVTLDAGDSRTIDAGTLFSGTDLSLTAASSDNGVVEAVMSAATLTVSGVRKGAATVTVAARNAAGTATVEVGVTVTAIAAERMAYENILGAMGRNMLSSVSTTIGGRFAAGTGGQRITVGGRRIDGLASSVSALASLTGHGRQAQEKHLALLNDAGHPRGVGGDYLLRTSSFVYAPEDQTATGGVQWTVWGAGDLRNFQGEPDVDASYDGSLKAAYLGFDVAVQRNWLAGVALSHATGQSDYDVTVASGTLESRLASVLPYVRWLCSTGLSEAWSIVGLGTGEVESEDATSDLSMRMAMVGIRTRLAGTGGTGLDVVGDAGLARLSTSGSESASLGDINANAQRIRIGLEGSRSTKLSGGTTLTPYAQLAGRYDGGTGQTGQGLEVTGGLRLSGGRVGINAQGRFLAVHTAEGYSENGFSLVASLSPGAGGTGLSMSVAPRVGAGTGDSGMMWRDRPLAGSSFHGRNDARAFRAEVGYGLRYPSMNVLMTPFGEMYLLGDERRQMRLGARLAPSGADSGGASVELSGMRVDRRGGASDHRIGLLARMSF